MEKKPLTDDEKKDMAEAISEIFVKHNHAINMDRIRDLPSTPWYKRAWFYEIKSAIKEWNYDHNPFARYKYVKSAEEYISLPWKERSVWYFWYKDALITGNGVRIFGRKKDREAVEDFLRLYHPIQFFLRKKGFALRCKFYNFLDWCSHTWRPRQKWLTKQIPKGWCDKTNLIPMVNFAIVVDFVEGEDALNVTDWEASSQQASDFEKQLKDCYDYIKVRRPALEHALDNSYPDEETMTGEYLVDYADHNRIEIELNKEDTKYLTWIMVNRDFFWT